MSVIKAAKCTILIMLVAGFGTVIADETCPYSQGSQEQSFWANVPDNADDQTWFKDYFTSQFVLHEGDWDGGWGWSHLEDHSRPFAKMYSAARMINGGIGDYYRWWNCKPISIVYSTLGSPQLCFDENGMANVFIRSTTGQLVRVQYDPYSASDVISGGSEVTIENITSACGSATSMRFKGEICVVMGPRGGHTRIIGLSADDPGNVVLFDKNDPASAWRAEVLSPSQELAPPGTTNYGLYMSNPIVIKGEQELLFVAGVNGYGDLVEYAWSPNSGAYMKSVVFASGLTGRKISNNKGALASVDGLPKGFRVYAVGRQDGHLLQYSTADGAGWIGADLTTTCGTAYCLDPGSTIAARRSDSGEISVFGRNQAAELIEYRYARQGTLSCDNASWQWTAINITQTAQSYVEPEGYLVSPVRIEDGFIAPSPEFVAGYDWQAAFVSYFKDAGEWKQLRHLLFDVSTYLPDWHKEDILLGAPIALRGQSFSLYGTNRLGYLVQYTHDPIRFSWSISRIPFMSADGSTRLVMAPLPPDTAIAPDGSLHIVGVQSGNLGLLHCFAKSYRAWHSRKDYVLWVSGGEQGADFHYKPRNESGDAYAWAYSGWGTTDRVEMACPSFEDNYGPAERAGTMLHEATHIKYGGWSGVWSHGDDDQDEWIHHAVNDIALDALDPRTEGHKHSMNQIQVEFMADIAEFPDHWVPWDIRLAARSEANERINGRFSNDPGWHVGQPKP